MNVACSIGILYGIPYGILYGILYGIVYTTRMGRRGEPPCALDVKLQQAWASGDFHLRIGDPGALHFDDPCGRFRRNPAVGANGDSPNRKRSCVYTEEDVQQRE